MEVESAASSADNAVPQIRVLTGEEFLRQLIATLVHIAARAGKVMVDAAFR